MRNITPIDERKLTVFARKTIDARVINRNRPFGIERQIHRGAISAFEYPAVSNDGDSFSFKLCSVMKNRIDGALLKFAYAFRRHC